MKILLIKPHYNSAESKSAYASAVMPLGLLSVATSLKNHGHDPLIIDVTIYDAYRSKIEARLEDSAAVGITAMTSQVSSASKIVKFIKGIKPDMPIIWGGVHPTLYPEDTVNSPLADIAVRGEGDETTVELLDCLKSGSSLSAVNGIAFKSGGRIYLSPDRPLLAAVPSIDYFLLPQIDKYIWADLSPFRKDNIRCVDLHAGRGCFYECTFCFENTSFKHRSRSAESLVYDIISLKDKFGITMVNIQDSDFFADKKRLISFVDLMIEKSTGVEWFSNCRSNYFNDSYINEALLKRMEASGCVKLAIGAESGSDKMLERMKKMATVSQLKTAIRMLNKTGIWLSLSFIVGMPDESEDDMKKTLKLICEVVEESNRHYIVGPAYFRPYPGCEMFKRAVDYGFNPPKSLQEWGEAQRERFGYLQVKRFTWLSNKMLAGYIVNIADFRHFKNYSATRFLYAMYKKIITLRLKANIWQCLWEDRPLLFIRGLLHFLKK